MIDRLAEYEQSQLTSTAWHPAAIPGEPNMQRRFNEVLGQATRWIVEHPEIALTGAAITGVVLGWLIKRR